jgi:ParB/RepB/Spo0J family partition protein
MSKSATAPAAGRFELVPLSHLVESPSNHRKRTWGDMDELVASVKAKGVLQPILVRPVKGIGNNMLELVFGHRRFRAAQEAGLEAIPAVIRELTDLEALEANVIENLQRADVHPLEEAEGYEQLLETKERAYTVDEIAAKVGKSKGYVYGRMKLLALCKEARKAFYDGKLTASTALFVARIPSHDLQRQALEEIEPEPWEKSPKSKEEVADIIRDRFMLRLADAPFPRDDVDLVRGAGACATCPKRSGAQPELFADLDKRDGEVCTDPPCFEAKKKAWSERRLAEAQAAGQKVIAGAEAKRVLQYGRVSDRSGYIDLNEPCFEDPKNRTWKQILGKDAPVALVQGEGGKVVEVVEKKAASDVLREKGSKLVKELQRSAAGADPGAKAERKRQEQKRLGIQYAITAIVEKAEKHEANDAFVRFITESVLDLAWHDTATDVARRRELEFGKGVRPELALDRLFKGLSSTQVRGLLVELLVTRGAYFGYQTGHTDRLKDAAKLFGVDLDRCKDVARADLKARDDAKKAKKKGGRRG